MSNDGDIRVFNPSKEISKEIILDILIRHRDAMKQARTGEPTTSIEKFISDNNRKFNQVRALNLIISAQREMITLSRPVVFFRSQQKWKKSNRTEGEQINRPFEKDINDYNRIKDWLKFLSACEQDILVAERTKSLDDDYIVEKHDQISGDKTYQLTSNFYEMLEELESSYEQIYLLMLVNKIVSAGIEEDEELTDKQKEEEMIRRVVEA